MNGSDFPFWLRLNHFINLFCIFLLMRSGIQILADHPKLYWDDGSSPGREWIKFGRKTMPTGRLWTSMDEAEEVNSFIALPGGILAPDGGGTFWPSLSGSSTTQLCHASICDRTMAPIDSHQLVLAARCLA